MPVVTDTLVRPDLTPITKATVEIRLFLNGTDGVAYLASSEIFPKVTLHPDVTGLISVTLPANSTLTPSGSYYQVDISIPGELRRTETFIVPNTAGPFLLGSILSVTPAAGIPFLSDALPLALAVAALAGTDTKTSRDDHVHPLTGIATSASVTAAVAAHAALGDPHPTYLTAAEGAAAYESLGAVATHAAAADPHPTYLTAAEGNAAYDAINAASSAITALKAATNTWALAQTFSAQSIHTLGVQIGADVFLVRDAANILAQRNGTTAQALRVYNTLTDASNYERGIVSWISNVLTIGTENAGTGAARNIAILPPTGAILNLGAAGATQVQIISNGLRPSADATVNFGDATHKWSTLYQQGSFLNYNAGFGTNDATNYERASNRWTANVYELAAIEANGTGTVRGARFGITGGSIAFLGAAPVLRQTLAAAASDAATTQTLVNDLRTALINLGLAV